MAVIWHEANGIGISNGAPKGPIALYFGTTAGWPAPPTPNQWQALDVTQFGCPQDTLWVELGGLLITTIGSAGLPTDEVCLSFQTPDPSWGGNPANYYAQCTAAAERVNMACSVMCYPLPFTQPDGSTTLRPAINWAWCRGNPNTGTFPSGPVAAYPTGSAYAFNVAIQKYGRAGASGGGGSPTYVAPQTDAEKLALASSILGALTRAPLPPLT